MRILLLTLFALIPLAVAACSGDDTTPTPTPSVCQQKDDLDSAIQDLKNTDVVAGGTDQLHKSVDAVKTQAAELKDAASANVSDEVNNLQDSINNAEDAVNSLGDANGVNQKIDQLQSAFTNVASAGSALDTALKQDCQ